MHLRDAVNTESDLLQNSSNRKDKDRAKSLHDLTHSLLISDEVEEKM